MCNQPLGLLFDPVHPLLDPVDPVAARHMEERRELFRLAGVSALARSRGGRDLDPEARAWAQHYAGFKPLGRALGRGEPVARAPEVSA